jgi:hypothetical protein
MVAQLGQFEFLVTGFDAGVSFELTNAPGEHRNEQIEILYAEEGQYANGTWQASRIWNGDQTDRGLNFRTANPAVVRIRLHTLPLYENVKSSRP